MVFTSYQYRPATLDLVQHDFIKIAQWVMEQLPSVYRYEHFGSTAIGVSGKGVIDIACLYPNVKGLESAKRKAVLEIMPLLLSLGCEWQSAKTFFPSYRPRLDIGVTVAPERHINVHIHLIEHHSAEHFKQRYFRQRLLCSPALREQYKQIKKAIIEQGVTEHAAYGKAKSQFVKRIIAEWE